MHESFEIDGDHMSVPLHVDESILPPVGEVFQDIVDEKIEGRDGEEPLRGHEPFRGHELPRAGQLQHGDERNEGAVLHQNDELSQQGGDGDSQGLGQDDVTHPLEIVEPVGGSRLYLPVGNGNDSGADDLRDVGPTVEGQGQNARLDLVEVDMKARQPEIEEVELGQKRCRTDGLDIDARKLLEKLVFRQTHAAGDDPDNQGKEDADPRNPACGPQALEKKGQILTDDPEAEMLEQNTPFRQEKGEASRLPRGEISDPGASGWS